MYDSYLLIDGMKGESTDAAHAGWCELYSFGFGISNPPTIGSGTGALTAGRANFSAFSVTKKYDKASVDLAAATAAGTHIKKCTVDLCLTIKGVKTSYIQYIFENCMISQVQWSGGSSGDDRPTENLSIAYGKVTWQYTPYKHDGSADSKIGPKGWDVTTNKAV